MQNGHINGNGSNGASGWALPGPGWIDSSAADEDAPMMMPSSASSLPAVPEPASQQQFLQAPSPPMLSAPSQNMPMTAMPIPAPPGFSVRPRMAMGNPDIRNGGHFLGMSTLVVGIGALIGAKYGGWYGGLAGSLFGGSTVNGYRAATQVMEGTPDGDREATISGTYAVLAAGLAGYVLYRSSKSGSPTAEPRAAHRNAPRSCGIRPVI